MNIEQIIKKYSEFYSDYTYTFIADKILEECTVEYSHRTLRKKISDYMNSRAEDYCCNKPETCTSECIKTSWNQEDTVKYFQNQKALDIRDSEFTTSLSNSQNQLQPYLGSNSGNILVVGDIHAPFTREGYLEHCLETQRKFDCSEVIFIGDIIDSAYSSFHPTSPDGYAAGEELDRAVDIIKEWYRVFPVAKVCLGNHDLIAMRKAFANGLSSRWIKGLDEVLGTPNWTYDLEFEINNVLYTHGTGSSGQNAAYNRALNWRKSVVQGHLHTESSVRYSVSSQDIIFGMQVGCGIDDDAYAFSYAKGNARKSVISCGVVLNSGTLPLVIPMSL